MKFVFEKLMEHRKHLEELAMRDLYEAQSAVDDAQGVLDALFASIQRARETMGEIGRKGGLIGDQLLIIESFIAAQKRKIIEQREIIKRLLEKVNEKRDELVARARDFKVLEKLKEKQAKRERAALKKREFKQIDNMVVMRFSREQE